MYFNPHKLLDGFIYHVGFEELGEASEEFRAEVLKAALAWQDNGKLVKLNLKYEAKIKELKSKVATLEKQTLARRRPRQKTTPPKGIEARVNRRKKSRNL